MAEGLNAKLSMRFYLGTHMVSQSWWDEGVPLFVSRRRLADRKTLPLAKTWWALDSGGFTELSMYGEWRTSENKYVHEVNRLRDIGYLAWVAPMDWMCEPFMLAKTRLTVEEHQRRTVDNFCRLRPRLGNLVIPVLQGWTLDDYHRCWFKYVAHGVDLEREPIVGLGSVCRRQSSAEAGSIVRSLSPFLRLHYFGAKITGLERFGDVLASADSMAWSYRARRDAPLHGCSHKSCANCPRYAMRWRAHCLRLLDQQRLEIAA